MNVKTLNTKKAEAILGLKDDHIVYPHAVVNTAKGMAVVSFEGVGWFEFDGKFSILCGHEWGSYMAELTKDQLLESISTEETTLHKLIDPHNDRTRTNLSLWENKIKDVPQNVGGMVYN